MATPAGTALLDHFAALRDPRQHAKVLYPLAEILLLVLSATIAGADDFVETTLWGTEHLAFLRRFYRYESGIPSHDTLCDVFAALDPELFKACFQAWVSSLVDADADIIAIDGKTSRRSHDRRKGRNPQHQLDRIHERRAAYARAQMEDGAQVRRLLAVALVLEGRPRGEAAALNGMDRQTCATGCCVTTLTAWRG